MNAFGNVNQLGSMAQEFQTQNKAKVSVRGWQNATQQDLLNFVTRKTRIAIQNSYVQGDLVIGYVNKHEVQPLLKFNGIRFAGNALKFEDMEGVGNTSTSNTISLLRNFLFKRYNAQTRMLDLGNMYHDPDLIQNGLVSNTSTQSKMFLALMKLASNEKQLFVESVNLSNNNLKDVDGISTLAQTFPGLKNLCLANNQISRFQSLNVWKNKFKELRELLMMNNPIANDPEYRRELLRIFPKMVILDSAVVRDENKLNAIYTFPMQLQQFFFEESNLGSSAIDFVTNFLRLWDTDRAQLMGLYTPQSQFSISVDSSVPATTVQDCDQSPSFGHYLSFSRNITKVSSEKSKQERLGMGLESIHKLFKSIPGTKHFLQEQPDNYSLQTWSYPPVGGFVIILHGFFEEVSKPEVDNAKSYGSNSRNRRYNHGYQSNSQSKLSKKSFDRTWVIVPNQGSVIIASDLLTIRSYVLGAWTKKSAPQPPAIEQQPPTMQPMDAPKITPVLTQPLGTAMQPQSDAQAKFQMEFLNRLHLETKLNAEYTLMLAEQSGWDYDTAIKGFQSSVNNLPRNAFL
ncbi:HEL124Wp [Eremothecium sinecaudum]|uniref:mRNA export factor MEX67 n=1 Tax=Eremothecium sinecaudum TaxID=45286 RepID=A0A0X8HTG7_9SACH|nr:HEL124Wp [Eremothecium sinecaudum]AMD21156.1 HEL124Wp [Eremothecium sinecaudum]